MCFIPVIVPVILLLFPTAFGFFSPMSDALTLMGLGFVLLLLSVKSINNKIKRNDEEYRKAVELETKCESYRTKIDELQKVIEELESR